MAKTFQAPKGTRDFFPADMALRRYIEDTWRAVSLRHGFLEVDGPTFEYLDLYKVKSGDEIVSQLFHFQGRADKEGQFDEFALRPEFTPTIARMIAAKANSLPRPIKWFSIPRCYRAENPQKGRLREFFQWNVDMLGGETPEARRLFDLECAALCLDCLREFGLGPGEVQLLWNDRTRMENLLVAAGVPPERYGFAFYLLDRVAKLAPEARGKLYADNQVTERERAFFEKLARGEDPLSDAFWSGLDASGLDAFRTPILERRTQIEATLSAMGLAGYARCDASIVRGLAYYTGFVWEVADIRGESRAVAGGGRYDRLIETFGGPSLPATGFGMGDVVLADLLSAAGKLPPEARSASSRAEVFVVNALEDAAAALKLLGELRRARRAAVSSYKTTKNIGKLLQEAAASGAKFAVILAPAEFARGVAKVKNMATREEREVGLGEIVAAVSGQ